MSELPEGWVECEIGEIAQVIGGGTPDANKPENFADDGGIAWITPADLSGYNCTYISRGRRFLTEKGYGACSAKLLPKGAVLFSSRAPIGYVAIAANEISTNQGFKSFVLNQGVIPEYIYYYLKFAKPLAEELASGTTFPEISGKNAAKIPVKLAPLDEQRRVIVKLEKLLSRVDAAQARLATVPRILKRFRQSVLVAACSGHLTADWRKVEENRVTVSFDDELHNEIESLNDVPDSWSWTTLEALCDKSRGITYGVIKLGAEVSNGVPCLRTSDVRPLRIEVEDVKKIAPNISANYRRTILKGGEVLVNVRGTLGGVAVVPNELKGWNVSREVAVVPLAGLIDPHFIAFWIAAKPSQNWLARVEKGVAYTGINLEDLRLLPVALPCFEEQGEIVRRVEALFKTADALEARYRKAKAHVDKLAQSILARAFRGELVTTEAELARREGRDYEPASVLLERIRQNRAQQQQESAKSNTRRKPRSKEDSATKKMFAK